MKKVKKFLAGSAFFLFAIIQSFSAPISADAATYVFTQTSWTGGSTNGTLAAPSSTSTQYATSSQLVVGANSIKLATGTLSTVDATIASGTFLGTVGTGSGTSTNVTLISSPTTTLNFAYSGAVASWTVPYGITSIAIQTNGAGNGGTKGGASVGTLAVIPGQTYYYNIGQAGPGYNGGMTWFSGTSAPFTSTSTFNSYVELVAGGAGGYDDTGHAGGAGGGLFGQGDTDDAIGGTQTAGGNGVEDGGKGGFGYGGAGGNGSPCDAGGAGGAGYYGGGGGGSSDCESSSGGGAGGSGYVSTLLTGTSTTQGAGSLNNGSLSISYQQEPGALFTYTGAVQSWTVPANVTSITIHEMGAGSSNNAIGGIGGIGGASTGTLAVTQGQTYYILVGSGSNGYGGGGPSNGGSPANGYGGGMTWFSGTSTPFLSTSTFNSYPELVAGGAGGAGNYQTGGAGGGTVGGTGTGSNGGGGGNQSAGGITNGTNNTVTAGSFGQGGTGQGAGSMSGYGGGGGGYYGGGGGQYTGGGGGGGSGYVSGAFTNATTTKGTGATAGNNGQLYISYVQPQVLAGYTGAVASWTVPNGVTSIAINIAGAGDGLGESGGSSVGTLAVTPGTKYYYNIGSAGAGYNGGMTWFSATSTPFTSTSTFASYSELVAGGAGGSDCDNDPAGGGGGLIGGSGSGGAGGTQSSGGSGTNSAFNSGFGYGGGGGSGSGSGGAGYYGGGGDGGTCQNYSDGSGGGGSGYAQNINGWSNATTTYGGSTGNGTLSISYTPSVYITPGTFTSASLNIAAASWGNFSWINSGGASTTITMQVRSASNAAMTTGVTSWYSIANGGSLSTAGFGANQYIQYQATLSTTNNTQTPSLNTVTIGYAGYDASGTLVSQPFNAGLGNVIGLVGWTETGTSTNAGVKLSVSVATSSAGLGASWATLTDASSSCTMSGNNVTCPVAALPASLESNATWWQYKVTETSTGGTTPTVSSVIIDYVINAPPQFSASGVTVSETGNSTSTAGQVTFKFSALDPNAPPGNVIPSYQYSLNGGTSWNPMNTFITPNPTSSITMSSTTYSPTSTIIWNAKADVGSQYTSNAEIMVTLNDGAAANAIATSTSTGFTLDTQAPTASSFNMNVGAGTASFNLTDSSNFSYRISGTAFSTSTPTSSVPFIAVGGTMISVSNAPITFGSSSTPTLYLEMIDIYGNDSYQTVAGPTAPTGFAVKDVSNKLINNYQTYLSWATSTIANFKQYDIFRATGGSYTQLTTITASSTGTYIDTGLSPTTAYYYELRVEDTNGSISAFTPALFITPTGNGGGPSISNVGSVAADTSAVVSWNTNILPAASYVYYSLSSSLSAPVSIVAAAATSGPPFVNTATLPSLTPSSTYYFYVQSTDAQGNTTIDSNSGSYYNFRATNNLPPVITSPQVVPAQNSATVNWTTNKPTNSAVFYGTAPGGENNSVSSTIGLTTNPVVLLTDLQASTTYYYYLYSIDSLNHVATTSESFFATSQFGPTISGVQAVNVTKNSASIAWTTNRTANSSLYVSTSTTPSSFVGSQLADATTTHALPLLGLAPSTTYYYYVQATDLTGNITTDNNNGVDYSFTTPADVTPPVITNITTPTLGQTVATIQWSTDKPSNSQVLYGTSTAAYAASTTITDTAPNGVASHSVSLTGLQNATPYYFEVISTDQYGNTATSSQQTLTTLTLPGPQITGVSTSSVDDFDATVTWNTNTNSDSHVYYSTSTSAFSASAGNGSLVGGANPFAHTVTLTGLTPGSIYYFYVQSTDQNNNATVDKNGLLYYSFATTNSQSPVISGVQAINIMATSTNVVWTTNKLADSAVLYGTSSGSYTASSSLLGASSTAFSHSLTLSGLTASTTYYYVVRSTDSGGNIGTSPEQTFNTLIPAGPQIYNVVVASSSDFGATVTWNTDTNSDSHIFYSNGTSTFSLSAGTGALIGGSSPYAHTVTLTGLTPSSTYYFYVQSIDVHGISSIDKKDGNYYSFFTTNVLPPVVSGVSVVVNDQTTAGITWVTDKPANSQVLYGTASGVYTASSSVTDTGLVTAPHSVALGGLTPATKYYFIAQSLDAAGNIGTSTEGTFTTLSLNGPKILGVTASAGDVVATISWNTDIDSDQFVFYSTSTTSFNLSVGSSTLVGNPITVNGSTTYAHSIMLSNLVPSSTYYFYVQSTDALGNISADRNGGAYYTFTTTYSQPPVITNIHTTLITGDTAGIAWTTNKPTDGTISYGTSTQAYTSTVTSSTPTTDHELFMTELQPNTIYFYTLASVDAAGNSVSSTEQTVTTQTPIFSNATTTNVSDYSAEVDWTTTIDSNSFVYYFNPTNKIGGTFSNGTSTLVGAGGSGSLFQHAVTISTNLAPGTTYEYYLESDDANGIPHYDDNYKNYYSFTTTDHRPPVISGVQAPVMAATSSIVTWVTDKPATSEIDYGTATGNYSSSTDVDPTLVTNHAVTLTNLTANTEYYYRVRSHSALSNDILSAEYNFTTSALSGLQVVSVSGSGGGFVLNTAPPVITNVATSTTPFDATVTFNTNESAIGFIIYGTSTAYGNSVSDATLTPTHSITIPGLVIGTTYHFAVKAIDQYGNSASTTDKMFTTQYVSEASLSASSTLVNAYQFQQELENSIASALPSLVPPFLETPQVTKINDTSATITWRTNINSYSVVYYATDDDFTKASTTSPYTGQSSDVTTKVTDHSLTLSNLNASTTYHVMAESFSIPGVFGKSSDITFKTLAPNVAVPVITTPQVVNIGDTSAAVTWTTNINSYSAAYYAQDNAYNPTKANPYTDQTSDVTDKVTSHSLALGNLVPGVTYHVMAESFTTPGAFATSTDLTFTTNAVGITATVSNVSTTAFRVSWTTNIPTNSIVQYKDTKTGVTQTVLDNAQVTFHNIGVENLTPAETYQVTASGYTTSGNLISVANSPTVATIKDITKPVVSSITIQTIIDPQKPNIAEAIVSWKTDKPATSVVSYGQGVGSSTNQLSNTVQDVTSFITNHVVILPNLTPGALYQVQISSTDQSGNVGVFPIQTIIVSQQSQSILDVILNNFENTFQFLQNIK
jgi:hypothetical protein